MNIWQTPYGSHIATQIHYKVVRKSEQKSLQIGIRQRIIKVKMYYVAECLPGSVVQNRRQLNFEYWHFRKMRCCKSTHTDDNGVQLYNERNNVAHTIWHPKWAFTIAVQNILCISFLMHNNNKWRWYRYIIDVWVFVCRCFFSPYTPLLQLQ